MKIKTLVMATVAVLGIGTIVSVNQTKASADSTMPVYRLYNHNTGEHFYTKNQAEQQQLSTHGWNYEGIGWYSATSGAPVYRVYNPNSVGGDHYYTMSKYEAQSLVNKGWHWDDKGQPVFYSEGNNNLYVAYNPNTSSGSHNYTMNTYEQNSLLNKGWIYGKVAWKTMSNSPTPPKPQPTYKYLGWFSIDGVRQYTKLCDTVEECHAWIDMMNQSQEIISQGFDHSINYGLDTIES
ncbi:glycoside hydrolase, family 25 [Lactococcus lactis]|uniref:glycoside hydrolase, family 25 n=1 Tax=Lactococcus lactis TaxID=1358 RepID=UPI002379CF75|nr:glycoside hydrolase, family 25 [Lactococcus lactis]WDA68725.1 glycoside hydrolase, family 25 [Lactococcus lactis]